jgi:hypothetical protein
MQYTQVGIQNGATRFGSLNGPDLDVLPVNSELSFDWAWETGFGRQLCWIDGARASNDADRTCKAPLTFMLPNRLNHTLTIVLQARKAGSMCRAAARMHARAVGSPVLQGRVTVSEHQLLRVPLAPTALSLLCAGRVWQQPYCGGWLWHLGLQAHQGAQASSDERGQQ